MPQFENEQHFSQDTFGMPQEPPTPLSNTYTFNPSHFPPVSPMRLSPFITPRQRASRWEEDFKLFDPRELSPLHENLELELEGMQKEGKNAEGVKMEMPFIIEPLPKIKKSVKKGKVGGKGRKGREEVWRGRGREVQTKLSNFDFKKKVIEK